MCCKTQYSWNKISILVLLCLGPSLLWTMGLSYYSFLRHIPSCCLLPLPMIKMPWTHGSSHSQWLEVEQKLFPPSHAAFFLTNWECCSQKNGRALPRLFSRWLGEELQLLTSTPKVGLHVPPAIKVGYLCPNGTCAVSPVPCLFLCSSWLVWLKIELVIYFIKNQLSSLFSPIFFPLLIVGLLVSFSFFPFHIFSITFLVRLWGYLDLAEWGVSCFGWVLFLTVDRASFRLPGSSYVSQTQRKSP